LAIAFLFDVDGTLTPSRQMMDLKFKEWFIDFASKNYVGLVTGSDYPKTEEQVGKDVCHAVGRVYNCLGSDIWSQGKNIYTNPWALPDNLHYFLLEKLFESSYLVRAGNHIEHRPGMVNFCVVGRDCTFEQRKEYNAWDTKAGERIRIATEINAKFPDVNAQVGGEISIDIFQKGTDKAQVIDTLTDLDQYTLYYFGDRTDPTGNDFPIAQRILNEKLGKVFTVNNWSETWDILNTLN
jgi:phosphomannomutase